MLTADGSSSSSSNSTHSFFKVSFPLLIIINLIAQLEVLRIGAEFNWVLGEFDVLLDLMVVEMGLAPEIVWFYDVGVEMESTLYAG